jgi:hypothetical protein
MLKTLMEKLMIDGVDVHAVMFLIASMFYNGHLWAVSLTSSLARGPPINGGSNAPNRWLVPSSRGVFALVAGIDTLTRSCYVLSETSSLRCDKR